MRKAVFSSYTPRSRVNGSVAEAIARYRALADVDVTDLGDGESIEAHDRAVDEAAVEVARRRPVDGRDTVAALDFAIEELEEDWNSPPIVVAVLRNLRRALAEAPATPCHPG